MAGFAAGALTATMAVAPAGSPAIAQTGPANTDGTAEVAPELSEQVAEAEAGELIQAVLHLPTLEGLEDLGGSPGHREEVLTALRDYAISTQDDVRAHLEDALGAEVSVVNSLWLTNVMLVEFPADAGTLNALGIVPGVERVLPNFELTSIDPVDGDVAGSEVTAATVDDRTWGIDRIEAHRVWDELGVTGSGTRVAVLDTGVDITHPDLAGKLVNDNPNDDTHPGGWMEFDGNGNSVCSTPTATTNHGTHVSGTVAGGDASGFDIGVAPDADLMHGLVIPGGGGSFLQVAAGMQWAVAPYDCDGEPAGRTPEVVNMSLGGPAYSDAMIPPTLAMRAANVFPAFAIGNTGLDGTCGRGAGTGNNGSHTPGNVYDAVGVGATDSGEAVATFSCGEVVQKSNWASPPADWPDSYVKPDVSAPGVAVLSSLPGGGHGNNNGTSMATPHVAGTVALMQSAAGGTLAVADMLDALVDTSHFDDRYGDDRPNRRYGQGRINAYEATALAALESGIEGTITNAETGNPVEGASLTIEPIGTTVGSRVDGRYAARVHPGTYDLVVERFGYESTTVEGVVVEEDQITTSDIVLTPQPSGDLTGTVTFDESGHSVPGVTIEVVDAPISPSDTTDVEGAFTLAELPAGDYRIAVDHPRFTTPAAQDVTVLAGEGAVLDIEVSAPPLLSESVAYVDTAQSRADGFADVVFEPVGVDVVFYPWEDLEQAAEHQVAILGYGLASRYDEDRFQAFLEATDANGTGVLFLDHTNSTGNGLRQLSQHTGQPESYDGTGESSPYSDETYYEVIAEHPVLDGYEVGDTISHDIVANRSKWIQWFDGYEGDGRQIIADVGRTNDGVMGSGIGVDQRPNNRHVLMSVHGSSATRSPQDWSGDSLGLFLNAVEWVTPETDEDIQLPWFALYDLEISPDDIQANDPVSIGVGVKNVGAVAGTYRGELEVDGEAQVVRSVTLGSGAAGSVAWTVRPPALGDYGVRLDYVSGSFNVRAPVVDLTAVTVDQVGSAAPAPLADATVELYVDGEPTPVGRTDDNGEVSFSIPEPTGRYDVVVRKDTGDDGGGGGGDESYLLHREITVLDDDSVRFAPQVLSGPGARSVGDNFAARVDLALDTVDSRHAAEFFVRAGRTAPYGYRFGPGDLIVSLDDYEAVAVHEVNHIEQDWVLVGEIISGLDWKLPFDQELVVGGDLEASIDDISVSEEADEAVVAWHVADANGVGVETVLASELRPFTDLPEMMVLEDITDRMRSEMHEELTPVLRLFDNVGEPIRGGFIEWDASPMSFALDPELPAGPYRLELEVRTGGYNGVLTTEDWFLLGPEEDNLGTGEVDPIGSSMPVEPRPTQ